MLAEFLTKLQAIVVDAQFAKHDTKTLPGKLIVAKPGGSVEVLEMPPALRRPTLLALDDIIDMAKAQVVAKVQPVVYVGEHAVWLVLDGATRHEVASMPLDNDEQFIAVSGLKDGRSFDVPSLVRFLRFELGGDEAEALVAKVRTLTFNRVDNHAVSATHGRDSMGKQVEATVLQAADVPDFIEPHVNVFANRGCAFAAGIGIGVVLVPQESKVLLRILPGHLHDARAAAMEHVVATLRKALPGVQVYTGSPSTSVASS